MSSPRLLTSGAPELPRLSVAEPHVSIQGGFQVGVSRVTHGHGPVHCAYHASCAFVSRLAVSYWAIPTTAVRHSRMMRLVAPASIRRKNYLLFVAVITLPLMFCGLLGWYMWRFNLAGSDYSSFFNASSGGLITIAVFVPTAYGIIVSNSALRLNRGRLLKAWPVGIFTFIFGASLLTALTVSLVGATGWQPEPLWLETNYVNVMLPVTILVALWAGCLMYLTIRQVSSRVSTNYVVLRALDHKADSAKRISLITELRDLALTSANVADMNRNDVSDRLRGLASIMAGVVSSSSAPFDLKAHVITEYTVAGEHVNSDEILAGDWLSYLNLVIKQTNIWSRDEAIQQPDRTRQKLQLLLLDKVIEISVRSLKGSNAKIYNVVKEETWKVWLRAEPESMQESNSSLAIEQDRAENLLKRLFKQAKRFPEIENELLDDITLSSLVDKFTQPRNEDDAERAKRLLLELTRQFGESSRLGFFWGEVVTKSNEALTAALLKVLDDRSQNLHATARLFDRMTTIFASKPDRKWVLAAKVALDSLKGTPPELLPDSASQFIKRYYVDKAGESDRHCYLADKCDGETGDAIRRLLSHRCAQTNWGGNRTFMELLVPFLMSRSQSETFREDSAAADLLSASWLTHIRHSDDKTLTATIQKMATSKPVYILRLIEILESLEMLKNKTSQVKAKSQSTNLENEVLFGISVHSAHETVSRLVEDVIGNPVPLQLPDFEENIVKPVIKFLRQKQAHLPNSEVVSSLICGLRRIETSRTAKTFVAAFDNFESYLKNPHATDIGIEALDIEHGHFELGEFLSAIPFSLKIKQSNRSSHEALCNRYYEACIDYMWNTKSVVGVSQLTFQFFRIYVAPLAKSEEAVPQIVKARLTTLCELLESENPRAKELLARKIQTSIEGLGIRDLRRCDEMSRLKELLK